MRAEFCLWHDEHLLQISAKYADKGAFGLHVLVNMTHSLGAYFNFLQKLVALFFSFLKALNCVFVANNYHLVQGKSE
jgi:hypothetical protein